MLLEIDNVRLLLVLPAETLKLAADGAATLNEIALLFNVAEIFVKFSTTEVFTNLLPASDTMAVVK